MEDREIILNVLERFIVKIKSSDILNQIYKYYISDYSQLNDSNRKKISLNYESINIQAQRKIFTEKNNYWNIKPSELKLIENHIAKYGNLDEFKKEIDEFLACDISVQREKMQKEEKVKENIENEAIKKILGNVSDNLFRATKKVLEDRRNFPYKVDVIRGLLSLALNVDQIIYLMARNEKLVVQRSYVEKYRQERTDLIAEGKLKIHTKEEEAEIILEK